MIREAASHLSELVRHLETMEETESVRERFDEIEDHFSQLLPGLENSLDAFKAASLRKLLSQKPSFTDVRRAMSEVADSIEKDGLESTIMGSQLGKLIKALRRVVDSFETQSVNAWRQYTRDHVLEIDEDLLDVLKDSGVQPVRVTRLRRHAIAFRRLSEKQLPSFVEWQAFDDAVSEATEDWIAITQHLDDDIENFLRAAVSPSGAQMEEYTETVQSWLEVQGAKELFRIRPA